MSDELCAKCKERPIYEYGVCSKCFLTIVADMVSIPIPGETEAQKKAAKETEEWLRKVADETP